MNKKTIIEMRKVLDSMIKLFHACKCLSCTHRYEPKAKNEPGECLHPSYIITTTKKLTDKDIKKIKEWWVKK